MINIFCDQCTNKGQLRISQDNRGILVECLTCNDTKRFLGVTEEVISS